MNELNNKIDEIRSLVVRFREHIEKDHPDPDMTQECAWVDDLMMEIERVFTEQVRLGRKAELTYLLEDFGVEDNVEPIKKRIAQLKDITKEDE